MIGSIVLLLALASSFFAMIMYYYNIRGYKNSLTYGRIAYHSMAMLVIIASAILWYFILTHQYQYKYVYNYSSTDLTYRTSVCYLLGGTGRKFYAVAAINSRCRYLPSVIYFQKRRP